MNGAPPLSLITLSLTCVASPSPARLEWVLSRSSLLVASPPISSRRLTTPTLAPSDPLARSCSFMQPALSSHRTRTLSLSLLSSLYMLTDTGTLSSSLPGWGISSTGPPLAKRHAPACRSTAHTAQRSTHALSRPTRLRLSVRHVSDRPRLRPSLLGSARLCSALLASALDASSSHGALLTSLLPLLLLLLLWLLLLLPVCASQRGQRGRRGLSRGSLSFGEPAGAAAAANDSAEPPPRRLLRD